MCYPWKILRRGNTEGNVEGNVEGGSLEVLCREKKSFIAEVSRDRGLWDALVFCSLSVSI